MITFETRESIALDINSSPDKEYISKDDLIKLINNIIKESPDTNFNWGLCVLKEKMN